VKQSRRKFWLQRLESAVIYKVTWAVRAYNNRQIQKVSIKKRSGVKIFSPKNIQIAEATGSESRQGWRRRFRASIRINNTEWQSTENLIFRQSFHPGILLITVNYVDYRTCRGRTLPLLWNLEIT
jgi:hypothetical protein